MPNPRRDGGQKLERSRAYVAAADHHLIVVDDTIRLGRGPRENLARPAIAPMFRSIGVSHGSGAIGVVLTGMLDDGAAGLADLKRCGGITVVQNPIEAMEPEMPLAAVAASDVDYQTPIGELGGLLKLLASERRGPSPPPPTTSDWRSRLRSDGQWDRQRRVGSRIRLRSRAQRVAASCRKCGARRRLDFAARSATATRRRRWPPSRRVRSTRRCVWLSALPRSGQPLREKWRMKPAAADCASRPIPMSALPLKADVMSKHCGKLCEASNGRTGRTRAPAINKPRTRRSRLPRAEPSGEGLG